jgi:hypothetical protein
VRVSAKPQVNTLLSIIIIALTIIFGLSVSSMQAQTKSKKTTNAKSTKSKKTTNAKSAKSKKTTNAKTDTLKTQKSPIIGKWRAGGFNVFGGRSTPDVDGILEFFTDGSFRWSSLDGSTTFQAGEYTLINNGRRLESRNQLFLGGADITIIGDDDMSLRTPFFS